MSALSPTAARALLGVAPGADAAALRRAYRAAARELHPDVLGHVPTPDETRRMAEVNEAYRLLRRGLRATPTAVPAEPPRPVRPPDAVIDTSDLLYRRPSYGPLPLRPADPPPRPPRVPRPRRPLDVVGTPPPVTVVPGSPAFPPPDPAAVRFAFGRHEGSTVAAVGEFDPEYLTWVVGNVRGAPEVVAAARAWLARQAGR
jgi:hypothetical protein